MHKDTSYFKANSINWYPFANSSTIVDDGLWVIHDSKVAVKCLPYSTSISHNQEGAEAECLVAS